MDGLLLLGLGLGALGWTGATPAPDGSTVDRRTLTAASLSLEGEGSLHSFRFSSLVLTSSGSRRDDPEWLPRDAEKPPPRRDDPFRLGPQPWDLVVGVDPTAGSWGRGASEMSVTSELSRVLMPLDIGVSLGLNVDLLGFEEYDGASLTLIDPRHGSPRLANLSTGLGMTIKF